MTQDEKLNGQLQAICWWSALLLMLMTYPDFAVAAICDQGSRCLGLSLSYSCITIAMACTIQGSPARVLAMFGNSITFCCFSLWICSRLSPS